MSVANLWLVLIIVHWKKTGSFKIDLYYTGLSKSATVTERGNGKATTMVLARDYSVEVPLNIAARNVTWFTFE